MNSEQENPHFEGTLSLNLLKPGESGLITGYCGNSALQMRLKELGLVRGVKVFVKRLAPLRDPMEILVMGYSLSLRKEDAAQIQVRKIQ